MQTMRRAVFGLLVATAGCSSSTPTGERVVVEKLESSPSAVTLSIVKWPDLESAIAAHKGRVVVLDVWAEY